MLIFNDNEQQAGA